MINENTRWISVSRVPFASEQIRMEVSAERWRVSWHQCISGCEQQQGCTVADGRNDSASSCRTLETTGSAVGSGGGGGSGGDSGTGSVQAQSTAQTRSSIHVTPTPTPVVQRPSSISACFASCCAESAKKVECNFILKLKLSFRSCVV